MNVKKIIDPRNGSYFLLLDNGKSYCEVLPDSFLGHQKSTLNELLDKKPLSDEPSAEDARPLYHGTPTKTRKITKETWQTQQKIDHYAKTIKQLKLELSTLQTQKKRFLPYKYASLRTTTHFIMGISYLLGLVGLLTFGYLIAF